MVIETFEDNKMKGKSIELQKDEDSIEDEHYTEDEFDSDIDVDKSLAAKGLEYQQRKWIDVLGNGHIVKKMIKRGQHGTRPLTSSMCTVDVTGKLKDGTIVEDLSDYQIQLGDIELVQGLDLAIALMDVGEIAEIEIGPRFAYGSLGQEPDIPPNATIYYTVKLKSSEYENDVDMCTLWERKEISAKKRERGNWWFSRNESTLAIQCYRRALECLSPTGLEENTTDVELQNLLEDRMKVYNNLAAAQIKTQAYDAALKSVESVLSCQPQNVKALFRKGKILHYKGEHALAYQTLLQAAKLEPETKAIQSELAILKEKNAKDAQHEKNLYRKMLGTHINNNNFQKNTIKEKSKNSSKLRWSLIGGTAAAVLSVFLYRFVS